MAKANKAPTLRGLGIRGMNNLPGVPGVFVDTNKIVTPKVVVNADAQDGAVLKKRGGYKKVASFTNCHSTWGGSCLLCVANGTLYPQALFRVTGSTATELCEVPGPRARVNYIEIDNKVYISNPHFTAIYDLLEDAILAWGAPTPPPPSVATVGGDMPPGAYLLAYTQVVDGQISGNGPVVEIKRGGDAFGIQLLNLPNNGQAWITHPDGSDLFLARVVNDRITRQAPDVRQLDSYNVVPAPKFQCMAFGHGRIWGAVGKRLYYSDPSLFSWFRARNFRPFLEDLVLVATVKSGLFVNSLDSTWFVEGTEPQKMSVRRVGDGAIPGTLAFALVEGTGYEISKRLSQVPSPVWLSPRGFVVGTQTGHLVHLSEGKVKMPTRMQGAAIYRTVDGTPRLIATTWGTPLTPEDDELKTIFSIGRLYVPKPISVVGEGGFKLG